MTPRLILAALCLTGVYPTLTSLSPVPSSALSQSAQQSAADRALASALDDIFSDPVLARSLTAVRVEGLSVPRVIYERNTNALVMPASNMKIVTIAVAAERLGWDYRYETRLEASGTLSNGTLKGDLIITGSGDPSIGSPDGGPAPLFLEWADTLLRSGIGRVDGRLIGDDNAFDDAGLGPGWAWDYLAAGYAAPIGALTYNENAATVRLLAGTTVGSKAAVELGPPGHGLSLASGVTTGPSGATASLELLRFPGRPQLTIRGSVPVGGATVLRTAAVDNPTLFFVDAFRLACASRGIVISGGAHDIDDVADAPSASGRRPVVTHRSAPLSALAGYAMKVSQNLYAETFLKTISRTSQGRPGTTEDGRQAVRETLAAWGVPADEAVIHDGSGLSRYNYLTATTIVTVLKHVWTSDRLRGPFVAELPVAGRDGSLELRMKNTVLDRNVQAKTGTISNVRALSGYLQNAVGEKLVFSIVANHYTAPNAAVDAVMERALERLVRSP